MKFNTYILWSEKLQKYYVGSTEDLSKRISRHNSGGVKFTSKGVPWRLVWSQGAANRIEAVHLEMKVKGRGSKRFLRRSKSLIGM